MVLAATANIQGAYFERVNVWGPKFPVELEVKMPFLMAWKDTEWLVETKWRRNNVNSISYCIVARMFAKEHPNELQAFNSAILRQELHLLQFLHPNYLAVILKFLWVAKWDESLKDECYWHCLMYLKLCNSYLCLLSQKFVRQSLMILCPNIKKISKFTDSSYFESIRIASFFSCWFSPINTTNCTTVKLLNNICCWQLSQITYLSKKKLSLITWPILF